MKIQLGITQEEYQEYKKALAIRLALQGVKTIWEAGADAGMWKMHDMVNAYEQATNRVDKRESGEGGKMSENLRDNSDPLGIKNIRLNGDGPSLDVEADIVMRQYEQASRITELEAALKDVEKGLSGEGICLTCKGKAYKTHYVTILRDKIKAALKTTAKAETEGK